LYECVKNKLISFNNIYCKFKLDMYIFLGAAMPGFDTLRFVHELELVGIPRTQAEGHARAFAGAYHHVQDQMATKQDLERTQVALKTDIDSLRDNTKADIANLSAETKADIAELRAETKADIANLSAETKADITALRAETKEGIANLRSETKADIEALRTETKADIAALRSETKEDIASLRVEMGEGFARIDASFQSLSTSIAWIKWTSTGMVTLCLAIAGACFEMLKRVSTVIQ
jgi:ribosomal protein L29